jgi:hypothetical protein
MARPQQEAKMSKASNETAPANKDAQLARLDKLLDEALSCTFPASDPISLSTDSRAVGGSAKEVGRSNGRGSARSGHSRNEADG